MIWQNELCAVCTCAILCVLAACLTVYAVARARVEGEVRIQRLLLGLPEEGEKDER